MSEVVLIVAIDGLCLDMLSESKISTFCDSTTAEAAVPAIAYNFHTGHRLHDISYSQHTSDASQLA